MRKEIKFKRLLAEYGRMIARRHLVMGAMGNISIREGKTVWIKRGGAWFERATLKDFIAVSLKTGKSFPGELASKELVLHLSCYKVRADIAVVVHTHPVMSTALATAGISLDASSPRLRRIAGSRIVTLPYYPPGSKKLAVEVKRAIKQANVVMLANHGLVTVGGDIKQACRRTLACETEAKKILTQKRKAFRQ